jgi:hypothetical protein
VANILCAREEHDGLVEVALLKQGESLILGKPKGTDTAAPWTSPGERSGKGFEGNPDGCLAAAPIHSALLRPSSPSEVDTALSQASALWQGLRGESGWEATGGSEEGRKTPV